jgi:acyl-CoA thioesterase-2
MENSILDLLDVEQLDTDLYRGSSFWSKPRPHLFGGQVAAQALRAATLTVPDDRHPHSLHGYFLRRGTPERPIILRVYRDRDGGSFTARRVVAIQDGEALFTVSASFHAGETSGDFQVDMGTGAPEPESLPSLSAAGSRDAIVEMRPVPGDPAAGPPPSGRQFAPASRLWIRVADELPDDDSIHACALTYISDYGSGFAGTEIAGLAQGGPSLDHCIWFHQPIRLDDWVLLDLWPLRASNARGTYMGTVHDRAGNLGGVLAQEALLRSHPGDLRPPAGKA